MGCIGYAVHSNSQATKDYVSEPGVRRTFFRAFPQFNNITHVDTPSPAYLTPPYSPECRVHYAANL